MGNANKSSRLYIHSDGPFVTSDSLFLQSGKDGHTICYPQVGKAIYRTQKLETRLKRDQRSRLMTADLDV